MKRMMVLAGHEEYSQVLKRLQNKMISVFDATHPYTEELPDDLSAVESLIWYCEPRDENAEIKVK